jgi:cytochrome P450
MTKNQLDIIGPSPLELLLSLPGIQSNPLAYLQQAVRRYGDFVRFQAGPVTAVLLNDPEAIKHVLQDNARNYSKDTMQYNALAAITGRGLLTSDGDFWFRQRRLLQPAFARPRLQGFGPAMTAAVARLLERWQPQADRRVPLDVDAEMMRVTLEIVGQALFSLDLSREAPALTGAALTCLDHIMYRARQGVTWPAFIPTRRNRRFATALQTLDQAVDAIIHLRRGAQPQADLLGQLVEHLDGPGEDALTLTQVRDEVITLLIAGHETVASALTWACYLLARNPPVQQRLRAELDGVLQGRLPTLEDLPELAYTGRVFEETLRLYPPAWLITRKAIAADAVKGGAIPAGALVIIGVSAMHQHPAYWPDPDVFDPDRFTPERRAGRPRFAYLPFGGGPRLCIGSSFAMAEAPLILAGIYQRYRLDLLPGYVAEPEPLVTIRPRNGLPMTLHRA